MFIYSRIYRILVSALVGIPAAILFLHWGWVIPIVFTLGGLNVSLPHISNYIRRRW